jgi:uncharacterized protein (DUF1800 family)
MLHVLSRATWGATPQDLALIEQIGIEAWLDAQLAWRRLPDPIIDAHLFFYPILSAPPLDIIAGVDKDYGAAEHALLWTRLYRATHSSRQLYERVVEFWTDHFNIPSPDILAGKILDDREVPRTHGLGRFSELLRASATSPAMLIYLDNATSYAEHPNENYARELLELHTLGVDGGYSETDVKEVARILTGWTLDWEGEWPAFTFNPYLHDWEKKIVLGKVFPAGRGIEEGYELLDFLAAHPSTAQFIAFKLVRFFVADQPPASLVNSAADVFTRTDGHIASVVKHIFLAPEFYNHIGTKFRRPTDLMVAMLRVLRPAMTLQDSAWLMWELEPLGHMPYRWFPPNGYPHHSAAWINTGALLSRWNLAFTLARTDEGWYDGIQFDRALMCPTSQTVGQWVDDASDAILHAPLAESEREWLINLLSEGVGGDVALTEELRLNRSSTLYGLLMSSPYFQWM